MESTAKFWATAHNHNHPWALVASAYWRRYPNPKSGHVFSEDIIDVRPLGGDRLYVKRFITKTNKLPLWGKHFFSTRRVPMIEETIIDRRHKCPLSKEKSSLGRRKQKNNAKQSKQPTSDLPWKTLVTYTRNIGLRYFMGVTERCTFQPALNDQHTRVDKEVWIESQVFGFQSAIRKFGVDRFKKNCVSATEGFDWVLERLFGKLEASTVAKGPEVSENQKQPRNPGSRVSGVNIGGSLPS